MSTKRATFRRVPPRCGHPGRNVFVIDAEAVEGSEEDDTLMTSRTARARVNFWERELHTDIDRVFWCCKCGSLRLHYKDGSNSKWLKPNPAL